LFQVVAKVVLKAGRFNDLKDTNFTKKGGTKANIYFPLINYSFNLKSFQF